MKILITTLAALSLSTTSFALNRTVRCKLHGAPNSTASILISDQSGHDEMLSVDIVDPDLSGNIKIKGTLHVTNVVGTSLYNDSQFLQDFIKTHLKNYDTVNVLLAMDGAKTAAEILTSIADDAAGIIYIEGLKNNVFNGGALLAGWSGIYTRCTEK